jgi:hypothetical protein
LGELAFLVRVGADEEALPTHPVGPRREGPRAPQAAVVHERLDLARPAEPVREGLKGSDFEIASQAVKGIGLRVEPRVAGNFGSIFGTIMGRHWLTS